MFLSLDGTSVTIEWLTSLGDAFLVDFAYFFQHSGDKTVSPVIDVCYNKSTETLEGTLAIAQSFWKLYGDSLQKEWLNFTTEYSPIQPYDVTEETAEAVLVGESVEETTEEVTDEISETEEKKEEIA